jgi:hypothetical protein
VPPQEKPAAAARDEDGTADREERREPAYRCRERHDAGGAPSAPGVSSRSGAVVVEVLSRGRVVLAPPVPSDGSPALPLTGSMGKVFKSCLGSRGSCPLFDPRRRCGQREDDECRAPRPPQGDVPAARRPSDQGRPARIEPPELEHVLVPASCSRGT